MPPNQGDPRVAVHVNADFVPSNDRKHVILGDDYQSQWNHAALRAAAQTVADVTPHLTKMLGAEHFWHLANALNVLADNANKDVCARVWAEFWHT